MPSVEHSRPRADAPDVVPLLHRPFAFKGRKLEEPDRAVIASSHQHGLLIGIQGPAHRQNSHGLVLVDVVRVSQLQRPARRAPVPNFHGPIEGAAQKVVLPEQDAHHRHVVRIARVDALRRVQVPDLDRAIHRAGKKQGAYDLELEDSTRVPLHCSDVVEGGALLIEAPGPDRGVFGTAKNHALLGIWSKAIHLSLVSGEVELRVVRHIPALDFPWNPNEEPTTGHEQTPYIIPNRNTICALLIPAKTQIPYANGLILPSGIHHLPLRWLGDQRHNSYNLLVAVKI
eukprot:CAMPEP_0198236532 /NCGR_PEP_ID=MMETSP1446-20131203/2399_1 /TAXON_ID=1461542 ORGANISM="Unidentified sp, Strain CCMP2111" /NCGR_SAMPLE_ID=MMETSP1446 /ASSEMBLY_ACC=CAM_ASM_001112 /LENGTH=285 /DNA_ID=CAMNT_0043918303 /DNA_START=988 /DNA_END=1845 /DNA_ORIENTATION=+